jgi:archaetidylinositol phosphate synthase
MRMLTQLKQKIQRMFTAQAAIAHKIGLTPNLITIVGAILAFLSAFTYALWQGHVIFLVLAIVLLLLSGFCDALDGIVARIYMQETVLGSFLDSVLDRYADAAVLLGIVSGGLCDYRLGIFAIIGSLLVSYSRARSEAAGVKMESIGFAERAERIIIIVAASFVAIFWQPIFTMNVGMLLIAALTNLTVIQRGLYFYKKIKKREA